MVLPHTGDIDWRLLEFFSPLGGSYDVGTPAIADQTAIGTAERLGDPGVGIIFFLTHLLLVEGSSGGKVSPLSLAHRDISPGLRPCTQHMHAPAGGQSVFGRGAE